MIVDTNIAISVRAFYPLQGQFRRPWIAPMNILPRDKQIAIVAALTEGCSICATERLTGIHRDTIMRLGVRVRDGCAALHDEMMRFVQVNRLELDELWSYVGKKQRKVKPTDPADLGDQYVFIGIDATRKAIISYLVGKRNFSVRMASRRFTRLTNGFSKKLENHVAAVSLYVAHFNLCRVHEALRITPAMAIGITDHIWTIGELDDRRAY